ncbi:glycosyltransferase family 39 protein [Hymenobacter sp. YC55]|uniref:ArnT family glycosyltransferase n=1 Tax=Hymenobacter sp. YC55 TaxID=3034019 RepID=UPI0023F80FFF|nr:glycosyltransferase family 39 protein [Hymenobacter sp. YC55]MDF7811731.1 glycosyltransferase family 39 protein [Hymenobacter sp. YC55]
MLSTDTQQRALPSTERQQGRWLPYLIGIGLLPLLYMMLVHKVGSSPILIWDEGRLAVNAAEMEQNGNWLVTYFDGKPDMWNTKPPLLIWLEVLSLRLLGYSETAFRLPTMIASVVTTGLVYFFSYRQLKNLWGAVFAVLILVTATGYNDLHTARTGDYDTMLTFWVTIAALAFFRYLERQRPVDFIWTATALALATLTKGVAGLFWAPAFLLYAIYRRRLLWLLRRPEVYGGVVAFLAAVLGYYFAREQYNPGYIAAVSENELGGRMLATLEDHLHPWHWYLESMYDGEFMPWVVLFPVSLLLVWRFSTLSVQRHFTMFAGLIVVLHMLIISSSSTKLEWYDMPMYPLAAMVIGLSLGILLEAILAWQYKQGDVQAAAFVAVFFTMGLFTVPVVRMYQRVTELFEGRREDPTLSYGFQIKAMATQKPDLTTYTLYSNTGYNASMMYYRMAAQAKYKHTVALKWNQQLAELKTGDVVVLCGKEDSSAVNKRFHTSILVTEPESTCATVLLLQPR